MACFWEYGDEHLGFVKGIFVHVNY